MKKNTLSNRLEIRVDSALLKSLGRICLEHNVKQSEVLREAVNIYLECSPLKYLLMEYIHDDVQFRKTFKKFLKDCPISLNIFFEKFLGPEEERNSLNYPRMPGFLDLFVTIQGRKAYLKRFGKKDA